MGRTDFRCYFVRSLSEVHARSCDIVRALCIGAELFRPLFVVPDGHQAEPGPNGISATSYRDDMRMDPGSALRVVRGDAENSIRPVTKASHWSAA